MTSIYDKILQTLYFPLMDYKCINVAKYNSITLGHAVIDIYG